MTALSPAASPTAEASRGQADPRLVTVAEDLDTLQIQTAVVTATICGEKDVRVRVWRDDAEVMVELLWCCPDEPWPAQLNAVRILGDFRFRTVWRHPSARQRPAQVVRFLADLLLLDDEALSLRYDMVG